MKPSIARPVPPEIILALDVADTACALPLLRGLRDDLRWVKVGLQLFLREGPALLDTLAELDYRIFLDLKLHDIPNTVAAAIRGLAGRPVALLTVHALGGPAMLARAVEAQREALPQAGILAVTVLTSMEGTQLEAIGLAGDAKANVRRLAGMALENGVAGLVCSPLETADLRRSFGDRPHLVTPGIRPAGGSREDQARVATPARACHDGSSHLVIGRPILQASDPGAALRAIQQEINDASQTMLG